MQFLNLPFGATPKSFSSYLFRPLIRLIMNRILFMITGAKENITHVIKPRPHKEVDLSFHRNKSPILIFQFTTSQGGRQQINTIYHHNSHSILFIIHKNLSCFILVTTSPFSFPPLIRHISGANLPFFFCALHIRTRGSEFLSHQNSVLFLYVPLYFCICHPNYKISGYLPLYQ